MFNEIDTIFNMDSATLASEPNRNPPDVRTTNTTIIHESQLGSIMCIHPNEVHRIFQVFLKISAIGQCSLCLLLLAGVIVSLGCTGYLLEVTPSKWFVMGCVFLLGGGFLGLMCGLLISHALQTQGKLKNSNQYAVFHTLPLFIGTLRLIFIAATFVCFAMIISGLYLVSNSNMPSNFNEKLNEIYTDRFSEQWKAIQTKLECCSPTSVDYQVKKLFQNCHSIDIDNEIAKTICFKYRNTNLDLFSENILNETLHFAKIHGLVKFNCIDIYRRIHIGCGFKIRKRMDYFANLSAMFAAMTLPNITISGLMYAILLVLSKSKTRHALSQSIHI